MGTQLGPLIRKARHAAGLTLEDLAAQVGVTPGALSHIESGRRLPSPSNAVAIAEVLGISREDMLMYLDRDHSSRRRSSLSLMESEEAVPQAASASSSRPMRFSEQPIEMLFEPPEFSAAAPRDRRFAYPASRSASMRDMARWSNDTAQRIEALDQLADSAAEAIRTLRGLADDDDPSVSKEARRLLRELDVRLPEE